MKWLKQHFGRVSYWGLFVPVFCLLFILTSNGCTYPSPGYYERAEKDRQDMVFHIKKNELNTYATAKNTGDANSIKELDKKHGEIPLPREIPKDQNSGDWIETLLYILLGMSGLGGILQGLY